MNSVGPKTYTDTKFIGLAALKQELLLLFYYGSHRGGQLEYFKMLKCARAAHIGFLIYIV